MSRPTVINHDVLTGEITEREMNDEEYAEWQAGQERINAEKAEQITKAAARQAVLNKLGLTADDLAALFE